MTDTQNYKVVTQPCSLMGDYVCLHGQVPQNELPHHLRHKIPPNEIWIRDDLPPSERNRILQKHEQFELNLMNQGLTYKQAHKKAEINDGDN